MKKNMMMRLASVLLVATLLSTCAISGTFAKYVTTESGSDSARVAKWGVELVVDSFKLFAKQYKTDDTTATFSGDYSVESGDNVLAPGTSGTFADIAITGTPEVAVDVAVVATVEVSGDWTVGGDFYCPIVVTVGTEEIAGTDYTSAAAFAAAIKAEIDGYSKQYAPNQDLSAIDANFDISWAWAFETGANDVEKAANNEKDTVLGDRAVAADLKLSIGLAITITQVD
jgi:hypothetical protein